MTIDELIEYTSRIIAGREETQKALEQTIEVLKEIKKCDEKSATKCYECINRIKNNGKKRNDKK